MKGPKDFFKKDERFQAIYRALFRYKKWIFMAILFTFLNTLLQVPFPVITKVIIDDIIIKGKVHLIAPAIIAILAIIPFMALMPFLYRVYAFKLTHKTGIMMRKALCEHFLHLELKMFNNKGPGYYSARIFTDVDRLVASIYQVLFPILQNLLLFLVGLTMVLLINWKLALIPILSFPLYGYLTLYVSRRLKKENAILAEKKAVTSDFFTDMLQRVENIRYHVMEKPQLRSFFKKDCDILRQNRKAFILKISLEILNNLIMILTPALVLILGIRMILNQTMTLGEYVAFTSFMTYMMGPIRFFFASNITFQDFKVALERIVEAFDWPVSREYKHLKRHSAGNPTPIPQKVKAFAENEGGIRLESVFFSYDGKKEVLKDVNLTIERGERIAVMGRSGSGKTTLLNIIMGLLAPSKGEIYVGSRSYAEIDVAALRKKMAFVEQEPVLFEGNVEDNIVLNSRCGQEGTNAVEQAARFAGAHDFIMQMEDGYKSDMKRLGSNLSVGQKQRIALSRSFYKDADLIILDEPTSAIDIQSTALIKETLQNIPPHKTIIMVTHNPAVAEFADRLVMVENGKIVHDGSPETISTDVDLLIAKTSKEVIG
jgi:subfamily B ATP-binding cassette protein MsbA